MTNMNVYWNEDYCGTDTQFETFQKSRYIARSLGIPEVGLSEWVKVKDPASVPSALAKAQSALIDGVDAEYLQAVMTGRPRALAESNSFGWDSGVYHSVLNSTAGILCAVDDVIAGYDHACSLSSGLHHARRSTGLGYCTVNSLAIGAMYAQKRLGQQIAILDLDAHFGGGTNDYIRGTEIKQIDLSTSNFDGYESNRNSEAILCDDPDRYLLGVGDALNRLTTIGPAVVFYNAGVDVFPFIEPDVVERREAMVAERVLNLGARTVIVMAGGYGSYEDIVPLHLATITAFAAPHLLRRSQAGPSVMASV